MKRIISILLSLCAASAFSATLVPVQLLNPTGSSNGQAIVSTGSSSAPAWGSPATLGGVSASAYALLASPTFTGVPAAPNASVGTNTTQIATTSFVANTFAAPPSLGNTTPGNVFANNLSAVGNDALLYNNSSGQSIPNSTGTTITNWTKISDRLNSSFNSTTGVFTAPVTGVYLISGSVQFASSAGVIGSFYNAQVLCNGVTVAQGGSTAYSTSTIQPSGSVGSVVCSLTAGQTASLRAFQQTGGALALNATAASTWVSIYRLP
jgi:C1q domain